MLGRRQLTRLLVALALSCHQSQSNVLADITTGKFHVGEKWRYQTRPGEQDSTLTIVKVESSPKLGTIVHISLDGLRIKSPHSREGTSETVSHMPLAESAVEKSVTTLLAANAPLPSYEEGYAEWRRAIDNGKGGVFTVSVAQAVDFVESTLEPVDGWEVHARECACDLAPGKVFVPRNQRTVLPTRGHDRSALRGLRGP